MTQKRPNIVMLVADDHRYESIAAHGNPDVITPNLDELIARGVSFGSTSIIGGLDGAVCAPSRACLHTGSTIFGATVRQTLEDSQDKLTIAPCRMTLGEAFRKQGYDTYAVGKWHNDKESFQRSFEEGNCIFFGGMSDHWHVPVYEYDPTGRYAIEQQRVEAAFSTELFTDAAVNYVEQNESNKPFLLYVAYTSPHDPRTAPEPYASMYAVNELQLPPNMWAEHPFDNGEMHVRDEHLASIPRAEAEVRQHVSDYYAMITHMDDQIGRIVEALRETEQLDNTIIVYTSDHGLAVGQHGLMGKQNVYEHSIRIPWIMCGPGIAAGSKITGQVMQMDIFPTLCDLAGIVHPLSMEGSSAAALVRHSSEAGLERTQMIAHELSLIPRPTVITVYKDVQRAIKDGEWKFIRYCKSLHSGEGSDGVQLFNLMEDPWETNNLAEAAEYEHHCLRLQHELERWMLAVHDPFMECFMNERR